MSSAKRVRHILLGGCLLCLGGCILVPDGDGGHDGHEHEDREHHDHGDDHHFDGSEHRLDYGDSQGAQRGWLAPGSSLAASEALRLAIYTPGQAKGRRVRPLWA